MANKEFEFKLKIDAEINSLLQKLESVKTGLSNLNSAGKMPNLEKNFGSITKTLTKLQERIAQPVTSASTFTSTQKELASLQVAFSSLNKTIEDLQQLSREEKLTLIDDATLKNLKEANNAIANFKSAWEKNLASSDTAKQLKEKHDAAKKLNDAAEKKLQTKRQEYELRKQGIADEKARREEESKTAKEAVENLKQRQELLQRLQKARKDLASASSEQNDASENYKKVKETSDSKKRALEEATSARDTTSSQLEPLKSWKATEAKYNHMDESGKKPDKRAAEYQRSKKSAKATGIDISTPEKLGAAIATLTETLKSQNSAVVESSRAYNAAEKERKKYADRVEKLIAVEDGVAGSFDKTTGALNTSKVRKYGQEVDKLTDELKDLDPALEGLSDNELKKVLEDTNDNLSQQKKAGKEASTGYEKAVKTEEDFENEIKSLTETVEKSKVALENAKRVMDEAEESARAEAYKALADELKKCGDEFKDLPLEYTEENFEAIKKIVEELENEGLAKVDETLVQLRGQFDATGKVIKDTEEKTAALKEEYQSFAKANAEQEAFEAKIKSFLGFAGAAQVLRSAVRDAMATIKELDATMTEMAVVTDLTVGDYWDQLPEYSKQASDLGVSINSAYKAATLYYQQGLKANEVTAISAETLKMARIAGIDAADATDKMTAALRGFNMELNKTSAQRVSDVYSELAAITAADTQEIANAMTKTASIASNSGMEFETTAAFLSQIIETTRESAETAGTAMKTVIARFQELKKDPAKIGEVDGEIVDANKIETALRSVGVSLRDTSGQFRDLDDVFIELSSKWDSLDTNTQRYIATIAAGSRQQSRFIAMMSNYSRTQELVAAANNSAGASNKQFGKTMDSIQAKIAKLENAWHEFTMGIMNSDLVKTGVDILTKLLEIINKATSGFNGMAGSITKILGILTVFKLGKTIFNKLREPMVKFFADIVREAGVTGEKAGKAAQEGLDRSKEENTGAEVPVTGETSPGVENNSGLSPKQKILNGLGNKLGTNKIKSGVAGIYGAHQEQKSIAKEIAAKQDEITGLELEIGMGVSVEGAKEAEKKIENLKKDVSDLTNKQKTLADQGYASWKTLGEGVGQAGAAMTGFGVAVSMIGGALASAGLEEAGELFATIGNYATMAGSALSAIGPAITAVGKLAAAAGISTAAAWGWVALILVGVVTIFAVIYGAVKQIEANDPDKKLKKAQEAADEAAKGADRAAESFNKLSDSLDSLDDQYDSLKEITKGTEKWNKAVQKVNSSVLKLIDEYPELAGFVENEGGILTLDVNSESVDGVLNAYKEDEVRAKGAAIGAKAGLARAKAEYDLSKMDDKTFEKFQTAGQGEAIGVALGNLGVTTAAGLGSGAAIGAGIGAFAGGVGAGPGAIIGLIAGGVTGLVAGLSTFQYTVDQVEKNNEQNRENVKELAQAYANGETGETVEEIAKYIERNGIAVGDAAEQMAYSLVEEAATMREYGETLNTLDAQEKAYYQAMVLNAQQLLDLGAITEKEMNQINTVFDEDLMKDYEEAEKARLQAEAENKDGNFDKEKKDFAKSVYGDKARVDGNKILDEKGEVLRKFDSDEAWINEMAAANATKEAAEAMEQIPGAILNSIKDLSPTLQEVFSKAFEGKDLTKAEAEAFKETMGQVSYKTTDKDGNIIDAQKWEELDQQTKNIWGSEEAYLKSLDADYSGIDEMWKNLSQEQKKAYGWSGSSSDVEGLDKAKEAFEATYTEIDEAQTKAFEEANKAAKELGITLSENLSSSAAQAWGTSLQEASYGAVSGEVADLNEALNEVLSGMTVEQTSQVMAEINAMDKMDASAWENLGEVLSELKIAPAAEALEALSIAGKNAYNAIVKVDFDTLAQDINKIYKTLDKTREGKRSYSKSDYKELIAANKALKDEFVQIGDEFLYVGGTMESLTEALERNTLAKLSEANRQLKDKIEMAKIVDAQDYGNVEAMGRNDLLNYLTNMRHDFATEGLNIADLGVTGLSNDTIFSKLSDEKLLTMATAVASEASRKAVYEKDYTDQVYDANVLRYMKNEAAYNAEMSVDGGEYAKAHEDALIAQAIQSGGVSNTLIEEYKKATDEMKKELGKKIAEGVDKVVKKSAGRDAYKKIIDKVETAMKESRQKEIDKLSEINESINDVNQRLIDKIQEQIDYDRQQDALEDAKENLSDLYARQAYLGMDTSGANTLELMAINKEIQNAEKDLGQTMVDQAIQKLADANEKAFKQGERQITLMQDQLDWESKNGLTYQRAKDAVDASLAAMKNDPTLVWSKTAMGEILAGSSKAKLFGLSAEDWNSNITTLATAAQNWIDLNPKAENTTGAGEEKPKEELTDDEKAKLEEKKKAETIANARSAAKASLESTTSGGFAGQEQDENSELRKAYAAYTGAGGKDSLEKFAQDSLGSGKNIHMNDFEYIGYAQTDGLGNDFDWDDGKTKADDGFIYVGPLQYGYRGKINGTDSTARSVAVARGVDENGVFKYANGYYIYHGDLAYRLTHYANATEYWPDINWKTPAFMTGGLADFTGPAWLDGTKSHPELVLNQRDTANFIQLKDILAEVMNRSTADTKSKTTGDNYFEIAINVDSIESDYDVEQIADKIRDMIYQDATYRNVNAINWKK